MEEDAGDCDERKRRAVVPEGEAAAAAWWCPPWLRGRRVCGKGFRGELRLFFEMEADSY